jgi:hypothetical protein
MTQKSKLTQGFQLQTIFLSQKLLTGTNTIMKSEDIINTVFFAAKMGTGGKAAGA